MNLRLDEGASVEDLFISDLNLSDVPDYFVFELSKRMPKDLLAKKLNTTVENIDNIIARYIDLATLVSPVQEKLDKEVYQKILDQEMNVG